MKIGPIKELDPLVSRLLDRGLSESEASRLNALLSDSSDARTATRNCWTITKRCARSTRVTFMKPLSMTRIRWRCLSIQARLGRNR